MDVMEIRPSQTLAYPSFGEYKRALYAQVFQVVGVKRGNYAVWKEVVAAPVSSFWLTQVCDGANTRGVR